jgi:hypothetical protein
MARGQAGKSDAQLGMTNAVAGAENAQQQALESKLIPDYTSLMNTGYLSPEEEQAAVTGEMGAATAPFETAKFEAANRAGATRNAADLTAQQDQLALEQGRTAGEAASNLQREKMANEEAGMYGLGQLKSQDQQAMEAMYGLGPSTLQARAAGGGWAQGFKDFGQGMQGLFGG